jgi:hypothetical protein
MKNNISNNSSKYRSTGYILTLVVVLSIIIIMVVHVHIGGIATFYIFFSH